MNDTTIPPVPFLRSGIGAGPQDGGCIGCAR